jgi:hypothetical protein
MWVLDHVSVNLGKIDNSKPREHQTREHNHDTIARVVASLEECLVCLFCSLGGATVLPHLTSSDGTARIASIDYDNATDQPRCIEVILDNA